MLAPVQISLHGVAPSKALQESIRAKAGKLERFYDRITGCRVVLSLGGHKLEGRQFCVHVGVKLQGGQIDITREHDEDVQVALREAFDAARRKLQDYVREMRGDVNRRAPG